jgi:predicted transcriptional regulator
MKPPCEIVVNKMLPHIRANIVRTLIQDYNMKQIEVSKRLGITQASVSQYLSSTRGGDNELQNLFPEMEDYAKVIAKRIASGENKEMQLALLCEVCSKIREEKKFCSYHRSLLQFKSCGICSKPSASEIENLD